MQYISYIIVLLFVFVLSKNIVKPFGKQLRLAKDPDGKIIYNITPITLSYVLVIIVILVYTFANYRHLNPVTIAVAGVFILLSLSSGFVNSRIVLGNKEFSYMYSTMKFADITKISITNHPKRKGSYFIVINTRDKHELKFSLPEAKKDEFKSYMTRFGKHSLEK